MIEKIHNWEKAVVTLLNLDGWNLTHTGKGNESWDAIGTTPKGQDCVIEIRNTYEKRRDILINSMSRAGWNIPSPKASMFAWAPLPEKFKNQGSLKFAKELMLKADVAVAPGVAFGEYGEGFVRVGLVENEQRIKQAAKNIKKLLQ